MACLEHYCDANGKNYMSLTHSSFLLSLSLIFIKNRHQRENKLGIYCFCCKCFVAATDGDAANFHATKLLTS